ncbi:MAG TPA: hypothetical protein VMU34_04415 [Mycobacterium sp.]|nr:hypothetical protein [Mycobacterium sp.]
MLPVSVEQVSATYTNRRPNHHRARPDALPNIPGRLHQNAMATNPRLGGYAYPGGYAPRLPVSQATVTMTHGYPALPDAVVWVANELLIRALDERQTPANVLELAAGPFHAVMGESGLILTEQQLRTLGPVTLHSF